MIISLDMVDNLTPENLKKLEKLLKDESSQLEKDIANKKVYVEEADGSKYFIKDFDDYIECKSCGYFIKSIS